MSEVNVTPQKRERPLSPHLQIYRWQLTMIMSILHRATGVALVVGIIPFTWWLVAAATGPEAYAQFQSFCASPLGLLMLLGWMASFYYHLANGIRHLIWDSGHLFKIKNAYASGYFVLIVTALLSIGTAVYFFEAPVANPECQKWCENSFEGCMEMCKERGICGLPHVDCVQGIRNP